MVSWVFAGLLALYGHLHASVVPLAPVSDIIIGRGGFGTVRLQYNADGVAMAIKTVHTNDCVTEKRRRRRIFRELENSMKVKQCSIQGPFVPILSFEYDQTEMVLRTHMLPIFFDPHLVQQSITAYIIGNAALRSAAASTSAAPLADKLERLSDLGDVSSKKDGGLIEGSLAEHQLPKSSSVCRSLPGRKRALEQDQDQDPIDDLCSSELIAVMELLQLSNADFP